MSKEIVRNYHLTDSGLMDHSKLVKANLTEELDLFTGFDTTINADYLSDFGELLTDAEKDVSDHVIIDQQVQLSDEADKKLKECNLSVRHLSYFVKKTFDSKAVYNEFGLNDFNEVNRSKSKMILFLRDMATVAVKYQVELIAQGCKQELIDKIGVLHDELNSVTQKHEIFKGNRPVITLERVIKYNKLWDKTKLVIEAAKIIHSDSLPKLKRYLSARNVTKPNDIKVKPGVKVVGLSEGMDENTVIEIKNTGKSALQFYVADKLETEVPENSVIITAGENATLKAETISNGTYSLLIRPIG